MAKRVFILGGTKEARLVADSLHSQGYRVLSSLAGVTASPHLPKGSVRIGGYGGDTNMLEFMRTWGAEAIVDCAHPFAVNIKKRGMWVAEELGIHHLVYHRQAWQAQAGDDWHYVDNVAEALSYAKTRGWSRIFAALGRQQFSVLAEAECEFLLLRQVPDKRSDGAELGGSGESGGFEFRSPVEIISGYPSGDVAVEEALLQQHGIEALICKDSGGLVGTAKLGAARAIGLPVILIRQPTLAYPITSTFFDTVEAVTGVLDKAFAKKS